MIKYLTIIFIYIIMIGCAKESRPTGGPVDNDAPQILEINPKDSSFNFNKNFISFTFNEYFILNNANSEILFSPPLKHPFKTKTKGKKLIINIIDTLKENTTYNIKFRKAIKDNTEGNFLKNKEITFSTGNTFDSLQILGSINNTTEEKNLIACLYDSTDSKYYTKKPKYITEVIEGKYHFKNLKPSKYKLIIINDENNNLIWDKKEKLAFVSTNIEPENNDTITYSLNLFTPIHSTQIKYKICNKINDRIILIKSSELISKKNIQIKNENKNLLFSRYTNTDTSVFLLKRKYNNNKLKLITDYYDTTKISCPLNKIPYSVKREIKYFKDTLDISYNKKIENIQLSYFYDSLKNKKKIHKEQNTFNIYIPIKEETNKIIIIIDSVKLSEEKTKTVGDTIEYIIPKHSKDVGILTINNIDHNNIVSLINENDKEVKVEKNNKDSSYSLIFNNLPAGKYLIKKIEDRDNNGIYSPGYLQKNILPETIIISERKIEMLGGWDIEIDYKTVFKK